MGNFQDFSHKWKNPVFHPMVLRNFTDDFTHFWTNG